MSKQKKLVLVTGGTRGIGAAIVDRLLKDKFSVLYTGTTPPKQKSRRKNAEFAVLDFADPSWVDALVSTLVKDGTVLYGVVNNAGVCQTAELGDKSFLPAWERVMQTNLTGPAHLIHSLVGTKRIAEGGRIVNISSQLGDAGRSAYSAYCASKSGLNALTKVWASELGERQILVNTVSPGWIETDMTAADLGRLAKESMEPARIFKNRILQRLDQKRFNTPEEVANIAAWLLSEESSGVTGRIFRMAGPSA